MPAPMVQLRRLQAARVDQAVRVEQVGKGGSGGTADSGGKAGSGGKAASDDGKAGSGGKASQAGAPAAGKSGAAGMAAVPTAGAGGTGATDDDAGTALPTGGPYLSSNGLQGYLWLAKTPEATTLSVTGYDTTPFTPPVCMRGTVAVTPDFSGNAMLGLNLNQTVSGEPQPFVPTQAGLRVDVTNVEFSQLRIQIQTAESATNSAGRWCAIITTGAGFIPWSSFNTACWDGSGTAYAREPIQSAIVFVPGATDFPVPFDVCLNGIAQADGPAPGEETDAGTL